LAEAGLRPRVSPLRLRQGQTANLLLLAVLAATLVAFQAIQGQVQVALALQAAVVGWSSLAPQGLAALSASPVAVGQSGKLLRQHPLLQSCSLVAVVAVDRNPASQDRSAGTAGATGKVRAQVGRQAL
jgi:hypothetical protein